MATEFLREKINSLNQLVLNEAISVFQQQLQVDAAAKPTGDVQVDQNLRALAQNAKAVILAGNARLVTYRATLSTLQAEQDAIDAAAAQATP